MKPPIATTPLVTVPESNNKIVPSVTPPSSTKFDPVKKVEPIAKPDLVPIGSINTTPEAETGAAKSTLVHKPPVVTTHPVTAPDPNNKITPGVTPPSSTKTDPAKIEVALGTIKNFGKQESPTTKRLIHEVCGQMKRQKP